MPEEPTLTPAEVVLRDHLAGGRFLLGVVRKRWRLVEIAWPYAYIAVSAALRDGAPTEYCFRFECTNYPQSPLTATPWDVDERTILADSQWPGGTERVASAFNPGWRREALYLPCDRAAIQGHDGWVAQHPHLIWNAEKQIVDYLEVIHDYLDSPLYTGLRGT